jgi:hypothetical protein
MLTDDDLAVITAMITAGQGAGEGFATPIVAGQTLVIPGIQSPNFSVALQTGWQILQSGLATFFNVVLSGGTITGPDYILNPAGFFFYSSTPAAGNLIASITVASGTDAFGNFYRAGITSAENVFGTSATLFGAALEFDTASANPRRLLVSPAGLFLYDATGGAGHLIASLAVAAGSDSFGNAYPQGLMAAQLTLPNQAGAPAAFAGGSVLYSSTAGRPFYLSSAGASAVLERCSINVAQFTSAAVSATGPGSVIGAPLSYQANEGAQGSEYEVEIDGLITTGSGAANVLTFGLGVDGAILGAQYGVGAVFLVASKTFTYTLRFKLALLTTGAGGTAFLSADGSIAQTGANIGSTSLISFAVSANSSGAAKAIDTTAAHTIQPYAWFASASTGQTLTTYRSKVARRF